MPSFGNMFASLTLESASFMSGLDAARKSLGNTQKTFERIGGNLQKVGAVMTVGITAPFIAAANSAMEGALAQRQAMAQVNAALSSMGPVAGRTAEQLLKTADAMEMNSLVDADVILTKVTANLLTFGNVAGAVFDRAQQAAVDMAQRMGGDVQASAMLVGKALNDPIKGLTALTRVGIQFTAAQKEQITAMAAAGNAAGAQGIILGELERQFGGAAAAAANTDPYRQMNVALGQAADVLGELALNILPPVTNAIASVARAFLSLPEPMQTFLVGSVAVGAALGPVVTAIGAVVTVTGAALPVLAGMSAGFLGLAAAEGVAATASYAFGAALRVAFPVIGLVTGAVALGYAAWQNWDKIKAIASSVVKWMGDMYVGVKTWVVDKLGKVWDWVVGKVEWVTDAFRLMAKAVVLNSYVPDMIDGIAAHMGRLDGVMVQPAAAATAKVSAAFKTLAEDLRPLLDELFPDARAMREFSDKIDLIERARKAGPAGGGLTDAQADEARRRLIRGAPTNDNVPMPTPDDLIDVRTSMDDLIAKMPDLSRVVGRTTDQVIGSFADMATDVLGAIGSITDRLRSRDWLGALEGVVGVVTQLAGVGAFGAKAQTNVAAWRNEGIAGRRANGGSVLPNRSYLVGERGPEILRMGGAGGSIVPNHQIGGGGRAISFDLRNAVLTPQLLEQMQTIANDTGGQLLSAYDAGKARAARHTKS